MGDREREFELPNDAEVWELVVGSLGLYKPTGGKPWLSVTVSG
jgi:hypothetical protein